MKKKLQILVMCTVFMFSLPMLVGFDTQNQTQVQAQEQAAQQAQLQQQLLCMPDATYGLRGVTSLDEIPVVGVMTDNDSSAYQQVVQGINKGMFEKIRYIASNGDQFCMWNIRLLDQRTHGGFQNDAAYYYWFMAPLGEKFSNRYKYCNLTGRSSAEEDRYLRAIGANISGSINESMLNRNEAIPLGERVINTPECPVALYQIVDEGNKVSVWVESTNCIQPGVGTCGTQQCTGTCLRVKTLEALRKIPSQKGWSNYIGGGENGRINWNGKLLVNFYYMNY